MEEKNNKLKIFVGGAMIVYIVFLSLFLITKINADQINRFVSIPEKPDDFYAYTREIWNGGLTDLCSLDSEYWKQPEFYGESWKIAKSKFYDNPDYSRWGVYGQGNIPREISYTLTNFKKGDTFEVCTFFHNGWGVWTYQGFKLVPWESEYFNIEITPNEFTTNPTFPVFEDGWTKQIKLKITAKKDIEPGSYNLGFNVKSPNSEYAREKTSQILSMKIDKELYKKECYEQIKDEEKCNKLIGLREKKYVNGGSYQTKEPMFHLILNIQ